MNTYQKRKLFFLIGGLFFSVFIIIALTLYYLKISTKKSQPPIIPNVIPAKEAILIPPPDTTPCRSSRTFVDMKIALKNPQEVCRLNLSGKNLSHLPEGLNKLSNLSTLNISNNNLDEIPEIVFEFKNLMYLNISNNKISILPKEIGKLTNLQYLDLSKNNITQIPAEISNLRQLRTLLLSTNPIEDLPLNLKSLNYLHTIKLSRAYFKGDITQISQTFNHTNIKFE